MITTPTAPGLAFEATRPPASPEPLRSDVAGFIGPLRRGPVGMPMRVAGWRESLVLFGGLARQSQTSYAARGYFENGGQVAHLIRIAGPSSLTAEAHWTVGEFDQNSNQWEANFPGNAGFRHSQFTITAANPGEWANRTRISLHYRKEGLSGEPRLDLRIRVPDEPLETIAQLEPANAETFEDRINAESTLIRIHPLENAPIPPAIGVLPPGPQRRTWELTLQGGLDDPPTRVAYLDAVGKIMQVPEVALLALPDLHLNLDDPIEQNEVLNRAIGESEHAKDRMVILDVPPGDHNADQLANWIADMRTRIDHGTHRAAAVYHPWVQVPDPLGGLSQPLRTLPPSGHVAGLISKLDRERGAHHTPANANLAEVVDIDAGFGRRAQALLNQAGINLLRCFPGQGVLVWGGRTLERLPEYRFVAHRRLVHRLVRAIRRVSDPLVFDINGPALWLTLVRAITSLLLEAWRAGALKGERAEEAFQVVCDETNNPPETRDLGRVFCDVAFAPAVPMEFILLRIALGREGELEVFES